MTDFFLDLGFPFVWSCSVDSRQTELDSFSISDLFFVFYWGVGGTSVLVTACVIFCAVVMKLIEESWFMSILPCCVFTEVAWITDEVWTTDEPFVVAQEGEISSWCFFSKFCSNVFITLSFLSNWFFKIETWSCSAQLTFLKYLIY